ncbi:MAG: hypothetical protein JO173_02600 [Gammaproteobacteria bacterium]|nr:hypothetical protein [Gammaproteobacteria bacterium]
MGAFDPERILRVLARRRVRYILVGAMAARLQGFPRLTADADISPAGGAANLKRLAQALDDLNARIYAESEPQGLAFNCDAGSLARANVWNLTTDAGRLDVIFNPVGTGGYRDLARSAVPFEVFGLEIRAASLGDILRSKRASHRPQDQQDAILISQMLSRG